MECNGMECNGMECNGMECNEMEWIVFISLNTDVNEFLWREMRIVEE